MDTLAYAAPGPVLLSGGASKAGQLGETVPVPMGRIGTALVAPVQRGAIGAAQSDYVMAIALHGGNIEAAPTGATSNRGARLRPPTTQAFISNSARSG